MSPDSGNSNLGAASAQFGQQVGQITAQALEDTVDVTPVISVAAGERVQIVLNRDVYLRRPVSVAAAAEERAARAAKAEGKGGRR